MNESRSATLGARAIETVFQLLKVWEIPSRGAGNAGEPCDLARVLASAGEAPNCSPLDPRSHQCGGWESNPHGAKPHEILNLARISSFATAALSLNCR
jgi:hypothetical protein